MVAAAKPVPPMPSRAEMLEWCRYIAPDFRLQYKHAGNATRALFTFRGQRFSVVADGETHRDDALVDAYRVLREATGYPLEQPRTRELEKQIIAARFNGDDARAEVLERELVQLNAGGASRRVTRSHAQTHPNRAPFGRREAW